MRTLEVAGAVGAGKTTVTRVLRTELARRGADVRTLTEARAGLDRSRARRGGAVLGFFLQHPALMLQALATLASSPISLRHRWRIARLVLTLGSEMRALSSALPHSAWVLVDEGWLHRVVNLFAWRDPPPADAEIESYLDRAPLGSVVLFVEAPPRTARERAEARGLPKRLRDRDPAEVDAFFERAATVLGRAVHSLESRPRGVQLLRITNDGSAQDLERGTRHLVREWMPSVGGPVYQEAWPTLPRPDRLSRRPGAVRAARPTETMIDRAVAHFGLAQPVRGSRASSPGGRGRVTTLHDATGAWWLLKEYKRSLSDDEIGSEHAVLRRLAELGRATPRLRHGPDGSSVCRVGDARLALFEFATGYHHPHERIMAPGDRRRSERVAGAAMADVHEALRDFLPPVASPNGFVDRSGPRTRPIDWYLALVSDLESQPTAEDPAWSWMRDRLTELEASLSAADLSRTVIHGDFGPYNILLRDGRAPLVIDFELARVDWRLTDLATALPRFSERRAGFDRGAALRVLEGYLDRAALPSAELEQMPSVLEFLALRRAIVCMHRHRSTGDGAWLRQAHERLAVVHRLASGVHPLARLAA